MPALRGLVAEGASGTLQTIHPALSPLIWNTMLTGVMPLEHRVLDFLRVNPVSGQREPITSDERKVPAVWNMATNAGKRVARARILGDLPRRSRERPRSSRIGCSPFSTVSPNRRPASSIRTTRTRGPARH